VRDRAVALNRLFKRIVRFVRERIESHNFTRGAASPFLETRLISLNEIRTAGKINSPTRVPSNNNRAQFSLLDSDRVSKTLVTIKNRARARYQDVRLLRFNLCAVKFARGVIGIKSIQNRPRRLPFFRAPFCLFALASLPSVYSHIRAYTRAYAHSEDFT